jgi:hypothetical protein
MVVLNGVWQVPEKFDMVSISQKEAENRPCFPFIAVDTEATGININYSENGHHPARPFLITACRAVEHRGKIQLETKAWQCENVDPFTREVHWSPSVLQEVRGYLKGYRIVFHNGPFDIRMLEKIGIDIDLDLYDDTLASAHVLDSSESHKLKELAIIEEFLPALMPREEIKKIALAKKAELGAVDKSSMGKFIGAVMKECKGQADGNDVKAVCEEILS